MRIFLLALLLLAVTAEDMRHNLGTGLAGGLTDVGTAGSLFFWTNAYSIDLTYGTTFGGAHVDDSRTTWSWNFDIYLLASWTSDMTIFDFLNWKIKFMAWPFYASPIGIKITYAYEFDPFWVCFSFNRNVYFGKLKVRNWLNGKQCRSSIFDIISQSGTLQDPLVFIAAQCTYNAAKEVDFFDTARWFNSDAWGLEAYMDSEFGGANWYGYDQWAAVCFPDDTNIGWA